MNAFDWFNVSPEWHSFSARLSLTLLHSLWQGIAVVAVAAVALRWLRQSSANSRYIVAGLALLCLPIAAALTYWMVELPVGLDSIATAAPETHSAVVNGQLNASQPPIGDVSVANLPESTGPSMPTLQSDLAESANTITPGLPAEIPTAYTSATTSPWLTPMLPWLSAVYLIGVATMLVRLLLGVWGGFRLRSQSKLATEIKLLSVVNELSTKLGLKLAPAVYFCERIAAPAVIGVVKPAILLPASLVTSLSPTELAAILSHELAHIRRNDLVLQFVQKFIETLFFFHPATWWLSKQINNERENCCDDLAASSGFGSLGYAAALLKVAELCVSKKRSRLGNPTGMLAADGSNSRQLSRRIERQLSMNSAPRFGSRVSFVIIALVAVCCIASVGAMTLKPADPVMDASPKTSEKNDSEESDMSIQAKLLWSSKADTSNPLVLDNQRVLIADRMLELETGKPHVHSGNAPELKDLLKQEGFSPSYARLSSSRKYLLLCGTLNPQGTFALPAVEALVWEVDSNKPLRRFTLMKASGADVIGFSQSFCADVSNDGKSVVAGDDSMLAVWDVQTGAETGASQSNLGSKRGVDALKFSPDGQTIAISQSNQVTYWDWETSKLPEPIEAGRRIVSFAFSPDSRLVAEGPGPRSTLQVRDLKTMEVSHTLQDDAKSPLNLDSMCFSPAGKTLFAANSQMVDETKVQIPYRLLGWDLSTAKLILKQEVGTPNRPPTQTDMSPSHRPTQISLSPDGKFLAAQVVWQHGEDARWQCHSNVQVWHIGNVPIKRAVSPVSTADVDDVKPEIVWGKSQKRTGLTAGAKLLSATGKLQPGDPVVVQFLLRNDSNEEQTVVLQQTDSHPVLGADNRVSLNVLANSQNRRQHILKPGAVLENQIYRVSVDTTGWPQGSYQMTARSAFWMGKKDKPNQATGIPHGKPISFDLGDLKDKQRVLPPQDADPKQKVHWGKPAAGISVGMRLPEGREVWPDDDVTIQGQMFAFNSTGKDIEFAYEIPVVPADWSLHLTSRDNNQLVRLDSTWYTGITPLRTRTVTIKSGEVTPLTGIRAEVTLGYGLPSLGKEQKTELLPGPTIAVLKNHVKFSPGDPKRLIGQTGRFDFHAAITIRRKDIPDVTVVASSAPVPFEIDKEKEDEEKPKQNPSKPGLGGGKKPNEKIDLVAESGNRGNITDKSASADDSKFSLDDVVWSDAEGGLEAGFLLTSPASPNQGTPSESVVKYKVLVRNKSDKDIEFAARLVPKEKEDSPYLIPDNLINEAIKSGKLPQKYRADSPTKPVEPRSPAWITQMVFQLGPGESAVIPNQRGNADLSLLVGTKGTGGHPNITPSKNGQHVLVQPLQIQTKMPPGGVTLLGFPTYTKVDQNGKTNVILAHSSLDTPSGTVFYPRIDLEFVVAENNRTESVDDPTKHSINVQGKTLDENGDPIAGAKVVLVSTNDDHVPFAQTVSDVDGNYEIKNAKLPVVQEEDSPAEHRNGSFETYAIAPGHGLAWRNDKTVYTFSLKPQPGLPPEPDGTPVFFDSTDKVIKLDLHFTKAVTIEGRVVDDQGEPIADAKIRLSKCRRLHPDFADSLADELSSVFQRAVPKAVTLRTTDADGRYRFTDLPSTARLHFVATRDGYAVEHQNAARLDQPERYDIKPMNMDGAVDFKMRSILSVPIKVVYADSKQPAAKVLISASGNGTMASVTTDQQGAGMLKLPLGEYDNIVLYPRIGTRYLRTNATKDLTVKPVQTGDDLPPAVQVFEIHAASELHVTFVDAKTDKPIPGLKLEVNGSQHFWREWEVETRISHGRSPKSDAQGKLMAMVPPGILELGVRSVNLQGQYNFNESKLEAECLPGEVKNVLIKVVPVEPKLKASSQSVELRFIGADNEAPIVGLVVEGVVVGNKTQKFGPFTTNEKGAVTTKIPFGFYRLRLTAGQETRFLPVDEFFENKTRKAFNLLDLLVNDSGVEKWGNGYRLDEGHEPLKKTGETETVTYRLLPACELVLRAVDAETGKGVAGVEFFQENALGEDWSRSIDGQNIGWKKSSGSKARFSDEDGYFRRLVSANAGYKYHVFNTQTQTALTEDATVDIVYGQTRAEHVFKLSKKAIDAATSVAEEDQ